MEHISVPMAHLHKLLAYSNSFSPTLFSVTIRSEIVSETENYSSVFQGLRKCYCYFSVSLMMHSLSFIWVQGTLKLAQCVMTRVFRAFFIICCLHVCRSLVTLRSSPE